MSLRARRVRWFVIFAIVLSMAGMFGYAARPWATGSHISRGAAATGSGLVCEDNVYNFGRLTLDEASAIEHRFNLQNASDHPIRIIKQSSTCGCVVTKISDKLVPPDANVGVIVRANWSHRLGVKTDRVFLVTDDEHSEPLMLTVRGVVVYPVAISPKSIDFGVVEPDEEKVRHVKLESLGGSVTIQPSRIDVSSKNIALRPLKTNSRAARAQHFVEYEVAITGQHRAGTQAANITFHFEERVPPFKLLVTARFPGMIQASPLSVCLRASGLDQIASSPVRITCAEVGRTPDVEIVWSSEGVNPFFIENTETRSENGRMVTFVTVGFRAGQAVDATSGCLLRVVAGKEQLDIPVVGIRG